MRFLKKAAAVFTVALLILNMTVFSFADSYNTIAVTSTVGSQLSYGGAQYYKYTGTYTKNNKTYNETAHAVVASLNAFTEVKVTSGSSLYGRSTLSQKLSAYNAGEGKRVIAAINGDFFSNATGLALGLQITDGIVRATNNHSYEKSVGRWSLGFKADGTAVVGQPDLRVKVTVGDSVVTPDRLNAYPDTNLVVINSDYSDKTYWNTAFAHDVVTLETTDALTLTGVAECMFVSYETGVTEPKKIEKNKLYIIAPIGDTRLKNAFSDKIYGHDAQVSVTDSTGLFNDVVTAMGGGSLLINDGKMRYPSTYDQSIVNTMTSRSAVGIKKDGSIVFYAVERTANGTTSSGVWMESVTQSLYDMGCVYAINLDGGGSTSIAAAKDGGTVKVQNVGQDGSQRRVSNCLLLVTSETAPKVAEDFEKDMVLTDTYEEGDLLTTTQSIDNPYTGTKSLQLDYKLTGIKHSVSTSFENGIDISAYDRLTLSVDGSRSGVMLSAVLEKDGVQVIKDIGRTDFEGYRHFEIETGGADKLCGFNVSYVIASNNSGKIYVDRITGYRGFSLTDNKAPTLTVTAADGKITASSADGTFESGKDGNGYYFEVSGESAAPTLANGSATVDVTSVTGNKMMRAVVDATDVFGNRARKVQIFESADYSAALPFADMKDGKWDEQYIRYCAENGIIAGMVENGVSLFKGSDSITRAQFCTMLVRKLGLDIESYTNAELPYEDEKDIPAWALPYVKAAYAEGIMTGSKTYTGIAFYASNNITRAEAATAINRIIYADTRLAMQRVYTDEKDIAGWAKESVASVTSQGIFDGDTDGRFYPKRNLSRSESAAIMSRI